MNRTDLPWNESFMKSPITGKYYLQFNSNYLIDIIRQAVRDIIIYDASLSDLVISELQKEIFLIYDNTNISVGELQLLLRDELKNAARFQKKILDLSYAQIEKNKDSISDMREEDNPWIQNFKIYRTQAPNSSRKTYGVIASMFFSSYLNICKSLKQITKLVTLLIEESILPAVNIEDMAERALIIILAEFSDSPFQIGGPSLSEVIGCMTQQFKLNFITSHPRGQDFRKMFCRYNSHQDHGLMNLFLQPQLSFPVFDIKPEPVFDQKKEEISLIMDRMLFGPEDGCQLMRERSQKKVEEKEYKMLRQFARFWKGYDKNEEDEELIYQQLKHKHEEFLKYLDQKQKERSQKAKQPQYAIKSIQAGPPAQNLTQKQQKPFFSRRVKKVDQASSRQTEQPKIPAKTQPLDKGSPPVGSSQQPTNKSTISEKQIGQQIQQIKLFNSSTKPDQTKIMQKQVKAKVPQSQRQRLISEQKELILKQQQLKHLKTIQAQLKQAVFTEGSYLKKLKIQICSTQNQGSLFMNQSLRHKEISSQQPMPYLKSISQQQKSKPLRMIKKTGKEVTFKQLRQTEDSKVQRQLLKLSKAQSSKPPSSLKSQEGEDLIKFKLTKDELRKLQKKKQITRITAEQAAYINSKQFKLASQASTGNEHILKYLCQSEKSRTRIQIKSTTAAGDQQKKSIFDPETIEKLSKYTMIVGSDDEEEYTTLASLSVTGRIQELLKNDEEKDNETQENKKKRNRRNKKKKNKKNQQSEECNQNQKGQFKSSPAPSKKEESVIAYVQKSQEQKLLVSYLENLKIEQKNRFQCFPADQYLKKWKLKTQKWKVNS